LSVSVLAFLYIDFLAVLSLLRTFFPCQENAPRKYERVRVYMLASWACVCVCLWDIRIFLYLMPMHFFIQLPCLYRSIHVLLLSLNLLACMCVPSNWPSAFYRFRVAATSNIRLIFVAMCRELGYDKIEVDVLWV
jgi:hypothetical protein